MRMNCLKRIVYKYARFQEQETEDYVLLFLFFYSHFISRKNIDKVKNRS